MNRINRRRVLHSLGVAAIAGALPRVSFADAHLTDKNEQRLVLVVLRGAVDGLALAPPYGESRYGELRGNLALAAPGQDAGVFKLDGLFGLHPSFEQVHAMYRKKEALVVQAVASPYRSRSHFDGQDVLETGGARVDGARSGWLNRALVGQRATRGAIALAQTVPLVLRGDFPVSSFAPSRLPDADDDTLRRLARLYETDDFFREQLEEALAAQAIAAGDKSMDKMRRNGSAAAFLATMQQTAKFLNAPDGPRIAVTEADGWDTHANQGAATGSLAKKFKALDAGLGALRNGLGANWSNTAVLVVTEFGRTVRVNGTRGTDHGTGTAALVLGGAVSGGRVVADWPGLASGALYQDRDLAPTFDLRRVFKAALVDHLGLDEAQIEARVFTGSAAQPTPTGWFNA